jgi:hypothetical protein
MAAEATGDDRIALSALRGDGNVSVSFHRGEVGILSSAGYQFPRRKHNKNDDSNQIRPASSFLELFMIDHCSSSQNQFVRCHKAAAKARLLESKTSALPGKIGFAVRIASLIK